MEALATLAELLIGAGESGGAAEVVGRMQEIDAQNPKTAELQRRLSERRPGASKAAPEPARAPAPAKPPAPVAARVPDIQEGALELEEEPAQEAVVWEVASGKQLPRTAQQNEHLKDLANTSPLVQVSADGKRLCAWIPGTTCGVGFRAGHGGGLDHDC